jgi:hypothetical protein
MHLFALVLLLQCYEIDIKAHSVLKEKEFGHLLEQIGRNCFGIATSQSVSVATSPAPTSSVCC